MVAGLVPVTQGAIRIDNLLVMRPQTNIGFVFQEPVLLDWRRALDNVMISLEARNLRLDDYREQGRRLLQSVGLSGFEDRYPYELSGSMRQRVSIHATAETLGVRTGRQAHRDHRAVAWLA